MAAHGPSCHPARNNRPYLPGCFYSPIDSLIASWQCQAFPGIGGIGEASLNCHEDTLLKTGDFYESSPFHATTPIACVHNRFSEILPPTKISNLANAL